MKAVVLHEADDMRLEDRPVPEPGIVRDEAAARDGSDVTVHLRDRRHLACLQLEAPLGQRTHGAECVVGATVYTTIGAVPDVCPAR